MLSHIHRAYHRHQKLIHRRLAIKAIVLVLIAIYHRSPIKIWAESTYTWLWLGIINSFVWYIHIDKSNITSSGWLMYLSGNTITIEHKWSESGIMLSITGDTIMSWIITSIWYPTTGYTTIMISPWSGEKRISISLIKHWREIISQPVLILYSNQPQIVTIQTIAIWGWGWGVRSRWSFSRQYNYRNPCLSNHLEKDTTYSLCTQYWLKEFYTNIVNSTQNQSIHKRIAVLELFYKYISYQDLTVQRHTHLRKIIKRISSKRSIRKTTRIMNRLLLFVESRSQTDLLWLYVDKQQLTREISYILKKATLNIWQKFRNTYYK